VESTVISDVAVFLGPSLAHVCDELALGDAHLADERLVASFFMTSGPQDHLGEDRHKIDSFVGQCVDHLSAVTRILLGADDSIGFQTAETVGQNIGGNFFARVEKLVKCFVATKHHVAEDQEGPAIAEHFDGGVERAPGAAVGRERFFVHD